MFKALSNFFSMFATLFSAGEHCANIAEIWSIYGEETAQEMVDAARVERAKTLALLEAQTSAE